MTISDMTKIVLLPLLLLKLLLTFQPSLGQSVTTLPAIQPDNENNVTVNEKWLYFIFYHHFPIFTTDVDTHINLPSHDCAYFQQQQQSNDNTNFQIDHAEGIREGYCQSDPNFLAILFRSIRDHPQHQASTPPHYKFIQLPIPSYEAPETNETQHRPLLGYLSFFQTWTECIEDKSSSPSNSIPIYLPAFNNDRFPYHFLEPSVISAASTTPSSSLLFDNNELMIGGCVDNDHHQAMISLQYVEGSIKNNFDAMPFYLPIVVKESFYPDDEVTDCISDIPSRFRYSSIASCISYDGYTSTQYMCDSKYKSHRVLYYNSSTCSTAVTSTTVPSYTYSSATCTADSNEIFTVSVSSNTSSNDSGREYSWTFCDGFMDEYGHDPTLQPITRPTSAPTIRTTPLLSVNYSFVLYPLQSKELLHNEEMKSLFQETVLNTVCKVLGVQRHGIGSGYYTADNAEKNDIGCFCIDQEYCLQLVMYDPVHNTYIFSNDTNKQSMSMEEYKTFPIPNINATMDIEEGNLDNSSFFSSYDLSQQGDDNEHSFGTITFDDNNQTQYIVGLLITINITINSSIACNQSELVWNSSSSTTMEPNTIGKHRLLTPLQSVYHELLHLLLRLSTTSIWKLEFSFYVSNMFRQYFDISTLTFTHPRVMLIQSNSFVQPFTPMYDGPPSGTTGGGSGGSGSGSGGSSNGGVILDHVPTLVPTLYPTGLTTIQPTDNEDSYHNGDSSRSNSLAHKEIIWLSICVITLLLLPIVISSCCVLYCNHNHSQINDHDPEDNNDDSQLQGNDVQPTSVATIVAFRCMRSWLDCCRSRQQRVHVISSTTSSMNVDFSREHQVGTVDNDALFRPLPESACVSIDDEEAQL